MPNHPHPHALSKASRDTLIVVLGMHRSGTSVLTRAMHVLGAELGTHLMPPAQGINDKGFFEDLDVNTFNIELMRAMDMDWHTMAPISLEQIAPQRMARFQHEALHLLYEKCAGRRILAIKDPRISRLLPFWQPIFEQLNRRVVYAIAFRNPISVSDSLAKRDQFPEEKSHLLWLAHTVPALDMTRGQQRAIISYDRLMDAPRAELERVAHELDLPVIATRLDTFERDFLENTLRHSRHTMHDVSVLESAPQHLKELYEALEQSLVDCTQDETRRLETAIAQARSYLDSVAPLLRCEWRIEQTLLQLASQHALVVQEHAAMVQSTSWRVTALLRAINRGLTQLKATHAATQREASHV
jgi:hypothetical protein